MKGNETMNTATLMMLNNVNTMNLMNNNAPANLSNPVEVIALVSVCVALLAVLVALVYVMVEVPVSRWLWNRRYRNRMKQYREKH